MIDDFSPPARIRSCVACSSAGQSGGVCRSVLAETGLAEDAADGLDVERLAGVRGADQGEQVRREIETGPDQADRLHRLAGAAGIHRRQHRPQRADQLTVRPGDRHPTVVDALDRAVAHDLDQDRVTLERSLLGGRPLLGCRLGCGGEIGHAVGGYSPLRGHRRARTCRPISGSTRISWAAATAGSTVLTGAGGQQIAGRIDVALDQAEGDRTELVVPGRAADETDRAPVQRQRGPGRRQGVGRAVQVQPDEPPGRPAQVVHPGDGLLAAVAPLVQVHGGPEQPELVGDGPVIAVHPDPGHPGGDPTGFVRPQPGRGVLGQGRRQLVARDEDLVATQGVRPGPGQAVFAGRPRDPGHRVLRGPIRDLHPHHEPHPVQPRRRPRRRLRARCAPRRSRRRRPRTGRARCGPGATAPAW